ncbi:hypothetical protein B0H63DRAFT_185112 [Podospora didyma]|uniref:Uncharacterized protein n=1 Tax=Podospora didyma TaxID=330526 RepID=A0AAE0TZQ3_9PEZI|nr:hypothetical protein B0H63DRAFT_185112 [Podospora didyma]
MRTLALIALLTLGLSTLAAPVDSLPDADPSLTTTSETASSEIRIWNMCPDLLTISDGLNPHITIAPDRLESVQRTPGSAIISMKIKTTSTEPDQPDGEAILYLEESSLNGHTVRYNFGIPHKAVFAPDPFGRSCQVAGEMPTPRMQRRGDKGELPCSPSRLERP